MAERSTEDFGGRSPGLTRSNAIDMAPNNQRRSSNPASFMKRAKQSMKKTISQRSKTDSESSDQFCQFSVGDSNLASFSDKFELTLDLSERNFTASMNDLINRLQYLLSHEEQLSELDKNMLTQKALNLLIHTDKFIETVSDTKSQVSDSDQVDNLCSVSAPETGILGSPEHGHQLRSQNFNLYKDRRVDLEEPQTPNPALKRSSRMRISYKSFCEIFRLSKPKSKHTYPSIEGPFTPTGLPVGFYMEQYLDRIEAESNIEEEVESLETLMRRSRPPFFAELRTNRQFISMNEDCDELTDLGLNMNRLSDTSSSGSPSVPPSPEMKADKRVKNAYMGALEIMTSEKTYVDILRLVFIEYREYILEEIKKNPQLVPLTEFEQIFGNLKEILAFNSELLSDFEARIENWKENPKIADVLTEKGQFLRIYSTFIKDFSTLNEKFKTLKDKFSDFKDVTERFESRDVCAHLKIEHFLLKPVQRLPQYQLLLKKYIENLNEDGVDFQDAKAAFSIVGKATNHADDMKGHVDNFQAMLDLQQRLGMNDLIQPNRTHIRSGALKKRNRTGIFDDIFLVLTTDILIYARPNGGMVSDLEQSPLKAIHKIPLTDMRIPEEPNSDEFPCDFHIESRVRSFGLRAKTKADKDDWVADLNKAITTHLERIKSFHKICASETLNRDLGDLQPIWIPDDRVTMCQKCFVEFNFFVQRRHHCRSCGCVVCASCSNFRAPLKYRQYQPARVCRLCYEYLRRKIQNDTELKMHGNKFSAPRNLASSFKETPTRLLMSGNDKRLSTTGFLHMKSNKTGKWSKVWCGLGNNIFYTFKAQDDPKAATSRPILGYELILNNEIVNEKKISFPHGQVLELHHVSGDSIILFAENMDTTEKWINAFNESISLGAEES